MKKITTFIIGVITLLSFTSCDTCAQTYITGNEIVYEYSYNDYPVRYVNGIAYYYHYNTVISAWVWVVLEQAYYPYIVRHRPFIYIYPSHRHFHHVRRVPYPSHPRPITRRYSHGPARYIQRPIHGGHRRP